MKYFPMRVRDSAVLLAYRRRQLQNWQEPHVESVNYIKQTSEIIGRSIINLRELSESFDGDFVKDFGIESSLANELLRLRRTGKYETVLDVSGERYPLGHRRDIIIFRITQELFNNIMKHADANKINVGLYYEPNSFTLSVILSMS